MKLVILDIAEKELSDIVDHYNEKSDDLGFKFLDQVQVGFKRIKDYPYAWPIFSNRSHYYLINRFPYKILYSIKADTIIIGGFMNDRQNPKNWKDR